MTQETIKISETPPLPGLSLVQTANKAFQTIATDFAGTSDPAALAGPYMTWADTGNGLLKRRNAAGSAWVTLGGLFAHDIRYEQGQEPTENVGNIWIEGIGPCNWDSDLSKYVRIPLYNHREVYTSNGDWTADAYTRHVRVRMIGGGGGGAYGGANTAGGGGGGGGGGAGEYKDFEAVVVPGSTNSVVIGAGGSTGTSSTNADPGGNTTFLGTTAAGGGGGGRASGYTASIGGAGGGQAGNNGTSNGAPAGTGGSGGASPFGPGGAGGARAGSSGNAGNNGDSPRANAYGAGGGGAGGSYMTTSYAQGSSGAPGVVIVEW